MTETCPTEQYECVVELRAYVQALTDQMQGFFAFVEATGVLVTPAIVLEHYRKIAELMQVALDTYGEDHGPVPIDWQANGANWVLREMLK